MTSPPASDKVYIANTVRTVRKNPYELYPAFHDHPDDLRVWGDSVLGSKGVNLKKAIVAIICPKCGAELGTVDVSKTTVDVSTKCYHCHIGVTFEIQTKVCTEKPYPSRVTSGGMRF